VKKLGGRYSGFREAIASSEQATQGLPSLI
jgi:hypothetical protein